ncbi:uncharacterized protein LOC129611212 isoform X2 [Condylostylus longicornis]|uniref:uncharacterized protein LOC129611212 isoform X2 n=1 Tax=Condylostylus longicornis TaxID=2530218 RepID=UPI00244DB678|nr:uncharacterized protein LOC129611212 isoform X2 [Condylostylus longicornis]
MYPYNRPSLMYDYNNMMSGGGIGTSPPMPDILGQYYSGHQTSDPYLHQPTSSSSIFNQYDFGGSSGAIGGSGCGLTGRLSPFPMTAAQQQQQAAVAAARRRRYSYSGLPSSMMADLSNLSISGGGTGGGVTGLGDTFTSGLGTGGYTTGLTGSSGLLHHESTTNIANLLNETNKSISRSQQILNQRIPPHSSYLNYRYSGLNLSYPTLSYPDYGYPHETNLMQLSNSFSSQPNLYFQPATATPYDKTTTATGTTGLTQQQQQFLQRLKPTLSSSNINNYLYSRPSVYNYSSRNYNPYNIANNMLSSNYMQSIQPPLSSLTALQHHQHQQSLYPQSFYQSHHLPGTLHLSNPALNYHYPYTTHQHLHHNHPLSHSAAYLHSSHLQQQIQQQLPSHQYHLHQNQQPYTSGGSGVIGSGSGALTTGQSYGGLGISGGSGGQSGLVGTTGLGGNLSGYMSQYFDHHHHHLPSSSHHHLQHHHPSQPHQQQQQSSTMHHHYPSTMYQVPLSKLDLDYSKPTSQESKRQVSFKFDVDTLSID